MKNFENASFKDFENVPEMDMYQRAKLFDKYLDYLLDNNHLNYRLETSTGCGPELKIRIPGKSGFQDVYGFVSNDYLGFTQHPKIKKSIISAIEKYGCGSAASPAIGGHFVYHQLLEDKVAKFFNKNAAIIYNTGYTANSATFQCLLQKEDLAILDMAVHASIYEGCQLTNVKTFLHNNLEMLERVLKNSMGKFRTRMVIVDGVYSQDGDVAPLKEILKLTKQYNAYLAVDDAHGIGVLGENGKGAIEYFDVFDEIDIIIGTFSKALGNLGGFVLGSPELIRFLKYQSKQHLFSTTSTPSILGTVRALELIDEEPEWRSKLWNNINYFKNGLNSMGLTVGNTCSAVVPVKIGNIQKTLEAGKLLLNNGIYANPIMYPAVSKKDARIRFNIMATHEFHHIDKVLNTWDTIKKKIFLLN
ncbi:glycine C-acetyltransferase [Aquiflexum balticum DSM 16537]|uniref:Glycine C-acetyltransferase n=1 Tax=Aquiflexum balticum DSM 16537 TaxID=758820 RepID=A0A1W2H475_9BACT|nr:aminotransferase class I/II-fold pyridoxal phosphate-dependent enzyme [Aquiflexum balticum]SMD43584.1 glycine C-acetyltransferase [Aquiflexum balticum DSM 16537]